MVEDETATLKVGEGYFAGGCREALPQVCAPGGCLGDRTAGACLRREATPTKPVVPKEWSVMRGIAALTVLAAAIPLAVPGVADASQTFNVTKSSGTIRGHLAQPATADGYVFAGRFSDSKLGKGATTSRGSFDGLITSGTLTVFLAKGTVRGTFKFTAIPNADGTVTYQGTTKYMGGTGAYRRARGSGQTTGTQDAQGYTKYTYTQTLKLPRR